MGRFHEQLAQLGFASYSDYLSGDHWKKFKRDYKKSGLPRCCAVCSGGPIQLHHNTYERLGNELFSDMTPLCREHHEAVHDWLKNNRKPVGATGQAVAFLAKVARRHEAHNHLKPANQKKKRRREAKLIAKRSGKLIHCQRVSKKILKIVPRAGREEMSKRLDGLCETLDIDSIENIRREILGVAKNKPISTSPGGRLDPNKQRKCHRCKLLYVGSDYPLKKNGSPSAYCKSCTEYMRETMREANRRRRSSNLNDQEILS